MTNIIRTPLVNATRTLWKTQNNSKIVGQHSHGPTAAFGCPAKAKPNGAFTYSKCRRIKDEHQEGEEFESAANASPKADDDQRPLVKFECGPWPATPDRIVRVFLTCLSPRRRRHDRFSPTALTEASAALCRSRLASSLSSAPKSNKGEEAATPGQPVAQRAFLEVPPGHSLSRIAGDRWLCRNHSAQPGTLTFR